MSDNSDNTNNSEEITITDAYGEPIEYDGNPAHAEGYLASLGDWITEHGEFLPLIEHHAALLSNGNLAVDSVQAVQFINGAYNDPRTIDDPCPPTATRISQYDARSSTKFTPLGTGPPP